MKDHVTFLKIKREDPRYRPVCERVKDFREVGVPRPDSSSQEQASRCMTCGTPFCHWACPLGNYIPEWNDLVSRKLWGEAFELLDAANNLPEMTGRICPALCEYSCVLGINDSPVTIRENELAVIEYAFRNGLIKPSPKPKSKSKKIAVVGSGPAGLACAAQLNKAGYAVTVFEKDDKSGGILRYGIPDFKLEKKIIDRRIRLMQSSGIVFRNGINVGKSISLAGLRKKFDAVVLSCGCRLPRDLPVEGRQLKGIHFALDFLIEANKAVSSRKKTPAVNAVGKRVAVIGGGDTGADCVGVCHRQGASCVMQIELFPQPPACRQDNCPWPKYPMLLKTSTSHQEGGERVWSVMTRKFLDNGKGEVKGLSCVKVEVKKGPDGKPRIEEMPGTAFEIETDLVVLALGFARPEQGGKLKAAGVELDACGNVKADNTQMTSLKGVFAAGDMRRGQSLVVWAVSEGRKTAHYVDKYLSGESCLPVM